MYIELHNLGQHVAANTAEFLNFSTESLGIYRDLYLYTSASLIPYGSQQNYGNSPSLYTAASYLSKTLFTTFPTPFTSLKY